MTEWMDFQVEGILSSYTTLLIFYIIRNGPNYLVNSFFEG